jgi:transcriptional regulator of acetoin/glycerol metabolism
MERQTAPNLNSPPANESWADNMPIIIETSHQRSQDYGLRPESPPEYTPLARNDLSLLIEQNRLLHAHAIPAMETLYQQIVNTHNMVILTDAQGVIVHSLGDDDFLEKASRVALQPGVAWSEQGRGTNAIGTAIAERTPAIVHADQHYLAANHFLTCSAAPIADHLGNVIGVLDVSGDKRSYHKHTMALVRMSALMIENQLFSATFEDAITLHFHTRPEFIGTLMEGIASFSPGGRFLAANRNGLFQLGLPFAALQSHTFSSLFGLPVSALYDHYRTAAPGLLNLCMHNGVRVYGRARLRLTNNVFQQSLPTERTALPVLTAVAANQAAAQARRLSGLRYLRTGDQQLELVIEKSPACWDATSPS